uniref:Protein kinase domain-containing protein n=1 Tax=Arcella intermedia TaxID=1963864 RepID=A0A6B2L7H6_9EUKA
MDCPVRKRFKMLSEAGAGGYGTIFEAKDIVHNKVVVVKRIDHQGKRTQYHNYNEIGILSAISHKNIVTYYDAILYFNEKKNIEEAWIVMEFLQGGSLQECSSALRLGFTHIAYIIREILLALEYLHKMGLAHRDLKSSNVMIGVDGDIKLIDFGLCEDMSSGPRYGTLGSPYWLSPEMIKQQSHSFATDIWSLGVCLIELILGDVPFDTPLKCMFKTATVGLHESIPKDIPEMTKDFLKQCLTQDQFQRPTSSALLQHPWLLVPGLADGIKDALDAIFVSKL